MMVLMMTKTKQTARRRRLAAQLAPLREKLGNAYGKAMDNELGDGFTLEEARGRIMERAAGYADSLGVDARMFYVYARERRG